MKLLILGGTGPAGLCVIEEALVRNYTLVIFARTPSKLPERLSTDPNVSILKGSIHDEEALASALDGVDAVVSTLGPMPSQPNDLPITRGYEALIKAMKTRGVKRIVLLGTPSIVDEHDRRTLKSILLIGGVSILARPSYNDIVAFGKLFASTAAGGLDATVVRVPILTNGARGNVQAGYVGDSKVGWFLSRKDLGWFFVTEVENGEWTGKLPVISSG